MCSTSCRAGHTIADMTTLPTAIGKPATRALQEAGIATLEAVAQHSAKELLALHGVGPKAIRVLTESLGAQGLAFRHVDQR